jgi:phage shock protein C
MIAGVAGGIAERWEIDPSLVRVGWVFLMLITGGLFFLLYLLMAIIVPEEPLEGEWPGTTSGSAPESGAAVDAAPDTAASSSASSPGTTDPTTGQPLVAPTSAAAAAPGAPVSARTARRAARRERRDTNAPLVFGGILVVIGLLAFGSQVFPAFDWSLVWPIGLIILGGVLVLMATRRGSSS